VTSPDVLHRLIDALEALQVPYMLVGALSVNQYADPRSTKDADIVVVLAPGQLQGIAQRLGAEAVIDRQLLFETATATRRNIIRLGGTNYRIELFHLSADPHDQERFRRRVLGSLDGRPAWVPLAEDVIVWKLRWIESARRGKDSDDVRNVLSTQFLTLDWPYIHHWCDQHGTRALLDEIIATIPPDLKQPQ